jgi:sialate O-acetylesterase
MVSPLVPFGIKGVIWYQGESNVKAAVQYRKLFPALIHDWRRHFVQGNFGFYYVQLANYMARATEPGESNWAELREAQAMTRSVPHTGMATAVDVGSAENLHPVDKQTVGYRLALIALAKDYGWKVEYSGPVFDKLEVENDKLRLHFTHAEGLKTLDGAPPTAFAIAGEDGKYVWANARIEGKTVVLWNETVKAPDRVRYGWSDNPDINLYNAADLPAGPFRTDRPPAP